MIEDIMEIGTSPPGETFDQFVAGAWARIEMIFRRFGEIQPMVHAVCRDGKQLIMLMPHFNNKDMSVAIVRAYFELRDVTRYMFVDEAWQVEGGEKDKDELMKMAHEQRLSEHPDRVEIVMMSAEDEARGVIVGQCRIIRGPGKPKLGPLKSEQWPQIEGRMIGWLPRRKGLVS